MPFNGLNPAGASPWFKVCLLATTTQPTGQSFCWATNTPWGLDANGDLTMTHTYNFGISALVATQAANRIWPAGCLWGTTTWGFTTGSLFANQYGLVVWKGMHPAANVWGSATIGDNVILDIAHYGALVASNTNSTAIPACGRLLAVGVTTVTQQLPLWCNFP